MAEIQTTIAPHTQAPYVQRTYPATADLDAAIACAAQAQKPWAQVPLESRIQIGRRFIEEFKKLGEDVATELTAQMGRPITQSPGEIRGLVERATYMLDIAPQALADVSLTDTDKPGFRRFIRRVPIGVVLIVAPWNFPYLTAINALLPALLAGNTVLLKPSPQTPLTAERLADAFTAAGLPENVLTVLHLTPELTKRAVQDPRVQFVSFTGSVQGGRAVEQAAVAAQGFKGVALELGGKDPAYVREDADLEYTVGELVDGAFFNSGQSCCSIERIYVHEKVYDEFVKRFVEITKTYRLGDPTDPNTNLGPVVSVASAERVRRQVTDAVEKGAQVLIEEELFVAAKP
ncbi:hypothetical protein DXG03_009486 [Asterophora parasitica]|uniref:Aldehyde dehydrogenase domain-containing protein n=1 Tax=Asterophora parasitica TaxID=117018 RepID=A0A9P7G4W1_9AGAR|nr:hypothetical protein DXG03_009486 [Asterophora parasitica]